ncbi:uncharacterized protein LOC142582672 isoform X2 [Dermacentor variabilis]|uniref:uncharacterized protein LOC142582672 isoform X2 n=1 Tax=Dermacentor variabilis TaxID=34621 RepID=UPI003F5C8CED
MQLGKIIRRQPAFRQPLWLPKATITVAFGRVGVTRHAEAVPPHPTSYTILTGSCQIVEAFSKANRLLGRDEDALLEDLRQVLDAGDVDLFQRAVTSTGTQSALERKVRDLFYGTASRHREVGTLTHLFTRIRRKGVSPLEHTESTRTNQRRLISVAQMQQVLELFSRSLERFSSSYFDDEEKTDAADSTAIMQQWSRYQVYNTEPLANAFECSQLLAGANVEELSAARQCGNDLALAIQAIKELELFLNCERHGPLGDPRSLPAVLANAGSNKASEVRRQCGDPRSEADAGKNQREQRCIVDGMIGVIQGLTDGVLGYVADCEASEASEALRDIASALRIEHVITPT